MSGEPLYLFSLDVEDPRLALPDGEALPPRVPHLVDIFLEFLARDGSTGTFFVVGEVARRHPDLIARIAQAGHEIGCHSDAHVPLDRQDRQLFRDDLERNLDALRSAGAVEVSGYRSPCFSLTERTRWAYEVLAGLGFLYSSSVLPAASPLYGWPGFGPDPRIVDGIVELPVSLLPLRRLPLPVGGVYFRVLPRPLLRWALGRRRDLGEAVLSYHHPYDIDSEQTHSHAEFRRWSPYDLMMRANRGAVLPRLEMVRSLGFAIAPYGPYARRVAATLAGQRGKDD